MGRQDHHYGLLRPSEPSVRGVQSGAVPAICLWCTGVHLLTLVLFGTTELDINGEQLRVEKMQDRAESDPYRRRDSR
jgi:hypothetical protein